jgi:hypothetical protein
MKTLFFYLLFFYLLIENRVYCQLESFDSIPKNILVHFPAMGVENCSSLNKYESAYFNILFKNSKNDFDFNDKKIGFITGSNASTISDKSAYFEKEKKRYYKGLSIISGSLYVFNNEEKELSGGFDAVIVYWSKVKTSNNALIKKLNCSRK